MSNILFPKLNKPRVSISTFQPLIGMTIPGKDKNDTGHVGKWIHTWIQKQLQTSFPNLHQPDLQDFGIEIKSKDVESDSAYSICSMSLGNILTKRYQQSNAFNKLQALLIIDRNDNFRTITNVELHYLDNDNTQMLLEQSYIDARNKVVDELEKQIRHNYGYKFKGYQVFSAEYADFETTQYGRGFQFRIPYNKMQKLLALNNNSKVMENLFTIS